MTSNTASTNRRTVLRLSAAAAAGVTLGCSHSSDTAIATTVGDAATGGERESAERRKVLLVFFSLAGENYFYGGRKVLTVGNTALVAGFIRDALSCDVFEIRPDNPYSVQYDLTVQRNVREQNEGARPVIIGLPASIAAYDTIVLGSPIWNVRVPRIMLTFAERFSFSDKTVFPFTTHAMSGLGLAVEEYEAACRGAKMGKGARDPRGAGGRKSAGRRRVVARYRALASMSPPRPIHKCERSQYAPKEAG